MRQTDRDKPWTSREIVRLRELAPNGAAFVAEVLDRSERSVRCKAAVLRISLRQPGQVRGLILGQPRGVSWVQLTATAHVVRAIHQLRDLVLAGELDAAVLESDDELVELCPACAKHPIDVIRTGLCSGCHHARLADKLRARTATDAHAAEGKRDHWRARQERSRAGRRPTPEEPE